MTAPTPDAGRHCRRCGISVGAANAGVLCEPPFAGSHDFPPRPMTAPTPDAGRLGEGLAEVIAGEVGLSEVERAIADVRAQHERGENIYVSSDACCHCAESWPCSAERAARILARGEGLAALGVTR